MASRYHFQQAQPSLGGQIGSALGTGLGKGLAALAETKLNKMLAKDKHAEDKQKLTSLGIPDHEADYLAHQDPETQWQGARSWLIAGGVPEQKLPQTLNDEWNVDPQEEEAAQQQIKQMLEQQGQGQIQQGLGQLGQQPQQQQMGNQPMMQGLPQAQQQQQQAPETQQQPTIAQPRKKPKNLGEAFRMGENAYNKATGAAERKQTAEDVRQDRLLNKEIREFSKDYQHKAEASKKNLYDYKLLMKAADSKDFRSGNTYQLLKKVGLEGFNRSFSTQLGEKAIARLGQNAGAAFGTGTRLTNYLEQTFQRSLPSLWNTPDGVKAISAINLISDQANIIKDDVRKQVLNEFKGKSLPGDIVDLINERSEPVLHKLENLGLMIAQSAVDGTPIPPPEVGTYFPIPDQTWTNKKTGEVRKVVDDRIVQLKGGKNG